MIVLKPSRGYRLLAGVLIGGTLFCLPATSSAQYWDYDRYDGIYHNRFGHDWYYDYYTGYGPYADPYPGTQEWRYKSDWELEEDVKGELSWSPFVDADDIQVSVKDGKVTLKGTVEDQSEVHDAIENAYEAGARTVISKLETREEE